MSSPDHEIIVAGAGPAGAVAAAFLADRGHDVLLLDQHAFPRDKICGDAVGPFALRVLSALGLKPDIENAGFYPVHSARIVAPSGQDIGIRFSEKCPDPLPTLIARRRELDHLIQKQAVKLGADFLQAKILDMENPDGPDVKLRIRSDRSVETKTGRVLLAADGSGSVIAGKLNGPHPESRTAVAARAYVRGIRIREHTLEGFLSASVWPGYGWIFPTGPDTANIGVGLSIKAFRKRGVPLKHLFNAFLSTPEIQDRLSPDAVVGPVSGWPLRLGWHSAARRVRGRTILIGDAAGLVNPLSGGGIANAVFSGKTAADVISRALKGKSLSAQSLGRYEHRLRKIVRRELVQSEWLRRGIFASPRLVNRSIRFVMRHPLLPGLLTRIYPDLELTLSHEV